MFLYGLALKHILHYNNRTNDYYETLFLALKRLYPTRDLSLVVINSFDNFHGLQVSIYLIPCKLGFIINNVHDFKITKRLTIL